MKYTEEQKWHHKMFGYYPQSCYSNYTEYLKANKQ